MENVNGRNRRFRKSCCCTDGDFRLNVNDGTTDVERNSVLLYFGNESPDFKGRRVEIFTCQR